MNVADLIASVVPRMWIFSVDLFRLKPSKMWFVKINHLETELSGMAEFNLVVPELGSRSKTRHHGHVPTQINHTLN